MCEYVQGWLQIAVFRSRPEVGHARCRLLEPGVDISLMFVLQRLWGLAWLDLEHEWTVNKHTGSCKVAIYALYS